MSQAEQSERQEHADDSDDSGSFGDAAAWPPPSYSVPDGHFDELRGDDGQLRPPWKRFLEHAGDLGSDRLARVQQQAARRIRENGVTYNLQTDGDSGRSRAWTVDALPFLLSASEWEPLAQGLRQRARLLEAMAADLYGEQRLVTDGLVPAALVLGHPDFARSVMRSAVPGGVRLHQVAFDLGRGPDGTWRVVGTRAQSPSGSGYALENRITISRLFPDAFRETHVHMLARFFRSVQARLRESAGPAGRRAHVVLLTPGPFSETYFEHAWLARYLGFTLAEGGDLTVREDRVYLQTLSGLEPVAGILRRLDDDFCDPLELRADSALGVAGLVSAWRAGNVVIANAFGAGILESPGLYGFLPPVCEHLLGQTLETASVPTWWCGEAAAFADAAADAETMVLKPAFSGTRMEPVFLGDLDAGRREALLAETAARGEGFVLQQKMPLSHVPVWTDGRLESRAVMLRVFLVADGEGDYRVMPGGLARVAGSDDGIVSGQRGGGSKDTWILSDAPVERFSMLRTARPAEEIARGPRGLSSRAGENLFWFGRYAERAENLARHLRAMLPRLVDNETFTDSLFVPVLECGRGSGLFGEQFHGDLPSLADSGEEVFRLAFGRGSGGGIAHDLEHASLAAAAVRDWLSSDSWRLITELSRSFPRSAPTTLADVQSVVERLIVTLAAVAGFEADRMIRDDGWRMVAIGRQLERLVETAAAVRVVSSSRDRDDPALLEWLLDLSDASIPYRARYRSLPEWLAVADLLVHDDSNPRSVACLLAGIAALVRQFPEPGADLAWLAEDIGSSARRAVDARRGELFRPSGDVATFLARAEGLALGLSEAFALRYFRHAYLTPHATAGIR